MSRPRYAIGIDLGTTNCVLAYVDLAVKHGRVAVLPIPQLQTRDTVAAGPLLPSFYYLGTEAHEPPCIVPGLAPTAALGVYAREQLDAMPGRVIHSAKSWLAHGGIDREARLLPFGSEELPDTDKRSPVEVSAAYLAYLRAAWDATIAEADPGAAFDRQHLIVTVPASFDEAAQALTRQAAALAGYPDGFRLLEEPQAAFYAWSAGAGARAGKGTRAWFTERLPGLSEEAQTVLVCDIGGGTTDLSLFRLALDLDATGEDAEWPDIERLAVSDHLLLGGDNIDLAIAHLIEARALGHAIRGHSIGSGERRLSRRQWQHLVPQSMRLKERILSGEGPPEEVFHVSIPGEGRDLFASVLNATLTRADLSAVILDGFFPVTEASERPRTRQMGLREIGLPYAVDTAVSRHLAGFLDGQAVDAVLFAGGTLIPQFLQGRLLTLIERWQGRRPIGLALPDLNLAIAEGAAHCAALVAESRRRIRAGYARSVYLELHRKRPEDATELVCILPQGFEEGRSSTLESRTFDLLLNRPARFTAYSSTHRREDRPGAIVRLDEGVFNPLPPLHTTLTLDEGGFDPRKAEARSVDVNLEVELTPLGVLQTTLVSEPLGRRWRLDFNLRGAAESRDPSSSIANGPASGLSDDVLRAGCERIAHFYGKKQDLGEKGQRQVAHQGPGADPGTAAYRVEPAAPARSVALAVSGDDPPRPLAGAREHLAVPGGVSIAPRLWRGARSLAHVPTVGRLVARCAPQEGEERAVQLVDDVAPGGGRSLCRAAEAALRWAHAPVPQIAPRIAGSHAPPGRPRAPAAHDPYRAGQVALRARIARPGRGPAGGLRGAGAAVLARTALRRGRRRPAPRARRGLVRTLGRARLAEAGAQGPRLGVLRRLSGDRHPRARHPRPGAAPGDRKAQAVRRARGRLARGPGISRGHGRRPQRPLRRGASGGAAVGAINVNASSTPSHPTGHRHRQHSHHYAVDSTAAERRTRIVIAITGAMMVVEIAAGIAFDSMALLADGWHMSTHVSAFLVTTLAYHLSRRHAEDPRYSFGTGKIGVLGGFASAVILGMVGFLMAGESVQRAFLPVPIRFDEAIAVAVIGLLVNVICALLLKDGHTDHHHDDLNLRSAYLHVLADAFTSVTAVGALLAGRFFGWSWLDPVMGLVGSAVVSVWAYGLLRDTGGILLDLTPASSDLPAEIRRALESDGDALITDLHVWRIGAGRFAAIVSLVAHEPRPVESYRRLLRGHEELVHLTIETQLCRDHDEPSRRA